MTQSYLFASPAPLTARDPTIALIPTASAVALRMGWFPDQLTGHIIETGNVLPIQTRADGEDTAVLALTWLDEAQAVFARADAGIQGAADLRGKRLGLPLGDGLATAIALRGVLTAADVGGLRPRQLELVDIDPTGAAAPADPAAAEELLEDGFFDESPEVTALLAGTADAIFLRGAAALAAAADPRLRVVVDINQLPERLARLNHTTLRPLTVRRSFLRAHPGAVVQALALLLRAAAWADRHHDAVVGVLASPRTGATARNLFSVHGPDLHRALAPSLDQALVRALERQKDFLRDWRFLTGDFNVTNWIVGDVLVEARELAHQQPPLVDEFTPYPTPRPSAEETPSEAAPPGW